MNDPAGVARKPVPDSRSESCTSESVVDLHGIDPCRPLIHPTHAAKVRSLVDRAIEAGARPLIGCASHPHTEHGLAAVVFTSDAAKAERIVSQLVGCTVWTNCFNVRDLAAPFDGSRTSGIGREGGTWSFDFFRDVKNVATRRGSFN